MRGKHTNHFTGTRESTNVVTFICEECSKHFSIIESIAKQRLIRSAIKFCSRECFLISRRKEIHVCKNCSNKVKFSRNKFCSQKCALEDKAKRYSKWRDKEYIKEYMKEYSKTESAVLLRKKSTAKRRAIIHKLGEHFSKKEWKELCEKYNNTCLKCRGKNLELSPDHIVPLINGGTNTIDNIQPLCRKCNREKWKDSTDYRNNKNLK